MNKFQIEVIKTALDDPAPLTDWEHDRMQEWAEFDEDYEFSEKQNVIINRVSQKYL